MLDERELTPGQEPARRSAPKGEPRENFETRLGVVKDERTKTLLRAMFEASNVLDRLALERFDMVKQFEAKIKAERERATELKSEADKFVAAIDAEITHWRRS